MRHKHLTILQQQKQESIKTEVNNNNADSDSKLDKAPIVERENNCETGRALIVNITEE